MWCVRWVGDWAWVLFAFVKGKVLRIKKYRPATTEYSDGVRILRFPFFMRVSRLRRLSRWWGYRIEPFKDQSEIRKLGEILYLEKDQRDVPKITMPIPFRPLKLKNSEGKKPQLRIPSQVIPEL